MTQDYPFKWLDEMPENFGICCPAARVHNQEESTMYETKVETRKVGITLDPNILWLIKELAQALQAHHLGYTTTESFAKTYKRDLALLNQAEDFLMIAQGEPQPWRVREGP